jgi:hypothetical protein
LFGHRFAAVDRDEGVPLLGLEVAGGEQVPLADLEGCVAVDGNVDTVLAPPCWLTTTLSGTSPLIAVLVSTLY